MPKLIGFNKLSGFGGTWLIYSINHWSYGGVQCLYLKFSSVNSSIDSKFFTKEDFTNEILAVIQLPVAYICVLFDILRVASSYLLW